jgi:uncharacterized protein (TIGR02147 family)
MIRTDIFDFKDYRIYLESTLERRSENEKGQRLKLAQAIGCHPGYLSKILAGSNDMSLEQAQASNEFLGHTPQESRFFLNLVSHARAGTKELKSYFNDELQRLKDERKDLRSRIAVERVLSEADQARYYSSWIFAGVHRCVGLDGCDNKEAIASLLGLSLISVSSAVEFLVDIGILVSAGGKLKQGSNNLFIDKASPFITKHHTNWRIKSIQSLDRVQSTDFHYSGLVSCTEDDLEEIREFMMELVQKTREKVMEAKDETLAVYTVDLFKLVERR